MNADAQIALIRLLDLVEELRTKANDPANLVDVLGQASTVRSCELARKALDASPAVEEAREKKFDRLHATATLIYNDLDAAVRIDHDQTPGTFDENIESYCHALFGVNREERRRELEEAAKAERRLQRAGQRPG